MSPVRVPRCPGRCRSACSALSRSAPGTCCPSEHQGVIAFRLYSEHLVTSGHGLPRREPEDLAGRSPDLDLLTVLIPATRSHSLHHDRLLFRPKTTFVTAGELQIH